MHALAAGLHEHGWRVGIVAPEDDPDLAASCDAPELLWRRMPLDGAPRWSLIRGLRRAFEELRPDVIHLHGHRAGLLGRLALMSALESKPAVVCTFHGYHPPFYRWPWSRCLGNAVERILLPRTSALIAVSGESAEGAAKGLFVDEQQIHVIPNAVPLHGCVDAREKVRARLELERLFLDPPGRPTFTVGTVARLHRQKGVDLLIEAWRRASRSSPLPSAAGQPTMRLVIVGDGPEREGLEQAVRDYRLGGSVRFVGSLPRARELLAGVDLFVLPSRWEGMPLTVLEAWDAGTPVLATDVEGTRELIRNDLDGFLVPPDAGSLARGIALLTGDRVRRERYVRNGSVRVREHTVKRMTAQTVAVYEHAVQEWGSGSRGRWLPIPSP